ncbi:hypothetical protein ASPWEDRAFT_185815 [Aspergillus wentii DTO 134E9]|uniref:Zn(2)-C6 fungal-type domain-containing protein n=1 Tax=Aspergillus wentii DTO 134E9 TaxID=1073089 RepID=A0A1L9REZ0_ASPWE|nr:uncharacterized protein ASPWEDRAFT_185815 [Aspergillus wentii DTO 134E9]OJJ33437.1 hypothetical protein ASPWEDRAFT_185815 [Aspergillus wentii DTO 134E9]
MRRRNGKAVSCEPCRISKIRCDHATPICEKCKLRGFDAKCYYHPAPLTRQKRKEKESVTGNRNNTEESDKERTTAGYLGSTSFTSVFSTDSNRDIAHAALFPSTRNLLNGNNPSIEQSLVQLVCSSISLCEELIRGYYSRSYFTVIPYPLIFETVSRARQYLQDSQSDENHAAIAAKITQNSKKPFQISPQTTLDEFYNLFTGHSLRWEFIGVIFSLGGFGALINPSHMISINGDRTKAHAFAAEMHTASSACLEICERQPSMNDIIIWLRSSHMILATDLMGDINHPCYRLFGGLVFDCFAMGLHSQTRFESELPFFLSETRKRIFAAISRRDKNLATALGRPPLIHRNYCDIVPPLDLDDEDVLLSGSELTAALSKLDDEGWSKRSIEDRKFWPATVIRMRYQTSVFREEVQVINNRHTTWTSIPPFFHYTPTLWTQLDPTATMVSLTIHLEYLQSVFQLHRISQSRTHTDTPDLLVTCTQMLSAVLDLTKQLEYRDQIRERYSWIFLVYGFPSAGVLVNELRACTFSNRPLPGISRAEVIRNLSVLVGWFENASVPGRGEYQACVEASKVVGGLLDEILEFEPTELGNWDNSDVSVPMNSVSFDELETSELFLGLLDGLDWDIALPGWDLGLDSTF